MRPYATLVSDVLDHGEAVEDRTGIGTLRLFGNMLKFYDIARWFPAVTLKKLHFGQVAAELYAFLQGFEWLSEFNEQAGCKVWNDNARAESWRSENRTPDEDVWLGRIYGVQWRRYLGFRHLMDDEGNISSQEPVMVDQLRTVVESISSNPNSRRHVVSAWNPAELDQMCLPPCHVLFQFYCRNPLWLDCCVYMRSVDLMLGLPFDIASYALLTAIVARETGRQPGTLNMMMGDCHVYRNHVEGAYEMLRRPTRPLPQLYLDPACRGIDSFRPEHARLENYDPNPGINFKLNV